MQTRPSGDIIIRDRPRRWLFLVSSSYRVGLSLHLDCVTVRNPPLNKDTSYSYLCHFPLVIRV